MFTMSAPKDLACFSLSSYFCKCFEVLFQANLNKNNLRHIIFFKANLQLKHTLMGVPNLLKRQVSFPLSVVSALTSFGRLIQKIMKALVLLLLVFVCLLACFQCMCFTVTVGSCPFFLWNVAHTRIIGSISQTSLLASE